MLVDKNTVFIIELFVGLFLFLYTFRNRNIPLGLKNYKLSKLNEHRYIKIQNFTNYLMAVFFITLSILGILERTDNSHIIFVLIIFLIQRALLTQCISNS